MARKLTNETKTEPKQTMIKQRRLKMAILGACLLAVLLAAGCASTKVTGQQRFVTGFLPRPGNILVYDFAATRADVPAGSVLANQPDVDTAPQTAEYIAEGRKLGAQIAAELVAQIRAMGMPAQQVSAVSQVSPQINDLVIHGYLVSVNKGNAAKRVTIGFGSGASALETAVEGFQMTAQGLRELGTSTVNSGGGKTPGAAVGAATFIATANPAGLIISSGMKVYGEASGKSKVEGRAKATATEIAKVLKQRFKNQGWIY
jgi:outer membrane murein-binding lipoprotein Lpp